MSFKPYHYEHIDGVIRHYALSLNAPEITHIMDNGIQSEGDAKRFCDFIPMLLDQRLADEQSGKDMPIDIGSGMIADLHYEAGSFVCDAGFESVWDNMIDRL